MRQTMNVLVVAAALLIGAGIGHVDSRPTWDDTGITAGTVFVASAVLSFFRPRFALAIALAVGGWIPLIEIIRGGGYGSLLALAIALVGALCGAGARNLWLSGGRPSATP
jgi:hypothetical protein